ncbi:hypothetical protein ACH4UM_31960 [Streptomyces sp. NPDC020801]|uniref:hypothetical protein n=1 Tax=unclassified Streptomyces TaxID=2593676 RepID=UPI0037A7E6EA
MTATLVPAPPDRATPSDGGGAATRRTRVLALPEARWAVIASLVAWDLAGTLPLPLGAAGHEGSTVIAGLNGLRLPREAVWKRAAA